MKLPKSQIIFFACLSFIVGVALANWLALSVSWLLVLATLIILSMVIIKKTRLIGLLILFCLLGLLRYQLYLPKVNENHVAFYNDQKVAFSGVIVDVDERLDHVKLTVASHTLKSSAKVGEEEIKGKVLIKAPLFPQYDYGDQVEVTCKLKKPEPIEDFRYDKYLSRYGIYSVCYNAGIFVTQKNRGSWLKAQLLNFKDKILKIINQTIPEPQAAFLAGILLGARKGLPSDLVEDFNRTGVSHIVAISGYNISVVAALMMNLCLACGLHRKRAFYVIVVGIIFFTIITGASAAVLRASIMGLVVLLAKQVGRRSQVKNMLAVTAAVMLMINPQILLSDAGFQLSFLATLGLIYGVPIFEKYFTWLPEKLALRENLTTTMSAIIFTTPLILYQFGRLSIVAPLVNVLILSFIPLAMLTGFVQVLVGALYLPAGRICGWVTWLILTYIIKVVQFFSGLKIAAINIEIKLSIMIFCYIMLSGVIIYKNRRKYEKTN